MKTYPCGTIPREGDIVKYLAGCGREEYVNRQGYVDVCFEDMLITYVMDVPPEEYELKTRSECLIYRVRIKDFSTLEFISRSFVTGNKVFLDGGNIEYKIEFYKGGYLLYLNDSIQYLVLNESRMTHVNP